MWTGWPRSSRRCGGAVGRWRWRSWSAARARWRRRSTTAAASPSARSRSPAGWSACATAARPAARWSLMCARPRGPSRAIWGRSRGEAMKEHYLASIDQGTASSRCIVFDRAGRIVSVSQKEHEHIFPRPGWVEHNPREIWANVVTVVTDALDKAQLSTRDLMAIGIANQRETTLLWDRETGEPAHNAINWQDTRTDQLVRELGGAAGIDRFRDRCGLPLATYFSGPKVTWLLDNVAGLRERAEAGDLLFGTMDSWLVWKLAGRHITDVTNAGRTMLMNLETLDWDDLLLDAMGVPRLMLPEIRASMEVYGEAAALGGAAACKLSSGTPPAAFTPRPLRSAAGRCTPRWASGPRRCSAGETSRSATPSAPTSPVPFS